MNDHVFDQEIEQISDQDLQAMVRVILKTEVADRHEYEPASSTGKYHPAFANGTGGLVRHTIEVVRLTRMLARTISDDVTVLDRLTAAAILHDMAKFPNPNSAYTASEHPTLMATIIGRHGRPDIAEVVAAHMGRWNKPNLPVPETPEQWVLHIADYLASRKEQYESEHCSFRLPETNYRFSCKGPI